MWLWIHKKRVKYANMDRVSAYRGCVWLPLVPTHRWGSPSDKLVSHSTTMISIKTGSYPSYNQNICFVHLATATRVPHSTRVSTLANSATDCYSNGWGPAFVLWLQFWPTQKPHNQRFRRGTDRRFAGRVAGPGARWSDPAASNQAG